MSPALPYRSHKIAETAERLTDGLYAGQQRFMREQGLERYWWGVELIESALGLLCGQRMGDCV